jgi:coenzyme F420-reducing hydrogenase delta subunit/ferredoxin
MLIPLAMGIALWLHITRLSRSKFLTGRVMTAWVVASLVLLSLIAPADVAKPARMSLVPSEFTLDGWYLLPVLITDRLGAGALWALVLGSGIVLYSLPWLLVRKRARIAEVNVARCNGCKRCYEDCPYEAIQMVPRSDAPSAERYAQVNPGNCLGCGICAGSCDASAIGLPWFDVIIQRQRINQLLKRSTKPLALVCAESVRSHLEINETTSESAKLPGYHVLGVPCAGLVNPLTVERALRRGAPGVLVVACGEGDCMYREGGKWTELRMMGAREPMLRTNKVDANRVRVVPLFRHELPRLSSVARHFADGLDKPPPLGGRVSPPMAALAAAALVILFSASTWAVTRLGYRHPVQEASELVISFKHPGKLAELCRDLGEAEKKKLPIHMRPPKVCTRGRADVRLRLAIDGREILERAYEPRGIWNDGNSIAIERVRVPAGRHRVSVQIGDTPDSQVWSYKAKREVQFRVGSRAVVLFDKLAGFQWFEEPARSRSDR